MSLARGRGNGQPSRCHAPPVQAHRRCRRTVGGRPNVGDLLVEEVGESLSCETVAGCEVPSPPLPSPAKETPGHVECPFWTSSSVPFWMGGADASILTPPPIAHEPLSNVSFCSRARVVF